MVLIWESLVENYWVDYSSASQTTLTLTITFIVNMEKFCTNAYTHKHTYNEKMRVPNTTYSIYNNNEYTQLLQKQNDRNYTPLYLSPFCHLENHTGDQTMVLSSDAEFLPDQSTMPNHSPLFYTIMKLSHKKPGIYRSTNRNKTLSSPTNLPTTMNYNYQLIMKTSLPTQST